MRIISTFGAPLGAVLAGLAVVLGAFGAHGLEGRLDAAHMDVYEKAVTYHFGHALAFLLASWVGREFSGRASAHIAARFFLYGILLFSGSLYSYAVTDVKKFALITPVGGVSFILGWIIFAWALRPLPTSSSASDRGPRAAP
ncbi:MAG: DUF423 domain-containing protein [Planctomycetota bacterium]